MRNVALILPVGPGFLIRRWVKVMVGVDQFRIWGGDRIAGHGETRRGAKHRGCGQELAPRSMMMQEAMRSVCGRCRVHDAAPGPRFPGAMLPQRRRRTTRCRRVSAIPEMQSGRRA